MSAPRVSNEDVRAIMQETPFRAKDLTQFIVAAHTLVETKVTPKGTLDEAGLGQVELWLAAHFVAVADPNTSETQDAKILNLAGGGVDLETERKGRKFRGQTGMGLSFTEYGQQAMLLDTTGALTALENTKGKKFDFACIRSPNAPAVLTGSKW